MVSLLNNKVYYYKSSYMFRTKLEHIRMFVMDNYEIGMHMQEFFEINIITRGKGEHFIENSKIEANVGDVFIVPPMVRHGYLGGEGFDVFHILISDEFIKKNITELQMIPSFFVLFTAEPLMRASAKSPLHIHLNNEQFLQVNEKLLESLKYNTKFDAFDALIRSSYALLIITLLCKIYTENSKKKQYDAELNPDESFMHAISMIHERYYEKLTISELSKVAQLSRSLFIKRFKEICGVPTLEYITRQRIEAAEYMLLKTAFSISEISCKCGFYDSSHFSKTFTAKRGISPSDYRKKSAVQK